ncbi:MAG: TauD/TfdA family dioxygenase, partial [Polyangiaceae bacterium]
FAPDSLEYTDNPLLAGVGDPTVQAFEIREDRLLLRWQDEAEEFDSSWLRAHDGPTSTDPDARAGQRLWDSTFRIPTLRYDDALKDPSWITALHRDGILAVHGIQPGDQRAAEIALERIASEIGVLHRRVHPTDINVLVPAPKNVSLDKAYTGGHLEYHTDAPYYDPPPKIAFLFCQSIEGGPTPVNYFSDGYAVARAIEREDPAAYKLLTSTRVHFARRRPRSHHEELGHSQTRYALDTQVLAPFIATDELGLPSILRVHTRSVTGLPPDTPGDRIRAFAAAYRLFNERIGAAPFVREIVIEPGTLIIFDNHRLGHARSAISTATRRVANLCYVDDYIWQSRLRLILAEKAALPERWLKGCSTGTLQRLANRWATDHGD